jgi:hypothetical protein
MLNPVGVALYEAFVIVDVALTLSPKIYQVPVQLVITAAIRNRLFLVDTLK